MLHQPVWPLSHKQLCDELQAERDLAKIKILLEEIDNAKDSVNPTLRSKSFS